MSTCETVTVDKLIYGGDGLARLGSGEVVFVPGALPGESVQVTLEPPQGKRPRRGHLASVTTPSTERVTPPCPVFESCGGCHWQHLSLESQRDWKRRIVSESLTRLGKLGDIPVAPTLGGEGWAYRNKVQWHAAGDDDGTLNLVFLKEESHDPVVLTSCHLVSPRMNEMKAWLEANIPTHPGWSTVQLQCNESGELLVSVWGDTELGEHVTPYLTAMTTAFPEVSGVVAVGPREPEDALLYGKPFMTMTLAGRRFHIGPRSFFQVNLEGADLLLGVLEAALPPMSDSILDVYSGVGTFAIALSGRAHRVVAVEEVPQAVSLARENFALNGITQAEVLEGDAAQCLNQLDEDPDVTLLDPPRKGCDRRVLDWIADHTQERIVYVSCNPTTLARDLRILVDAGWQIDTVQPIDLFPQTYHVETVAVLTLAPKS